MVVEGSTKKNNSSYGFCWVNFLVWTRTFGLSWNFECLRNNINRSKVVSNLSPFLSLSLTFFLTLSLTFFLALSLSLSLSLSRFFLIDQKDPFVVFVFWMLKPNSAILSFFSKWTLRSKKSRFRFSAATGMNFLAVAIESQDEAKFRVCHFRLSSHLSHQVFSLLYIYNLSCEATRHCVKHCQHCCRYK